MNTDRAGQLSQAGNRRFYLFSSGHHKVGKFIDLMSTFGILGLTRTGKVALPRK